jgi:AcrR family transcriptional regulator
MPQRTRAIRSDGARSRAAILEAATQLSSISGLEGLSIGALADAVGMSKGGLYAHFDSKEDLQLSVIRTAREIFIREIATPAMQNGDPLDQLRALAHGFLRYVEQRVFPGGCFFVSAAAEFGSRRGPVHDEIAAAQMEWADLLRTVAEQAISAGRLPPSADADQLAFQLAVMLAGANLAYVLHDDPALLDRARGAVDALLSGTAG